MVFSFFNKEEKMKKFWVNARYYLAPLLIFASLFGVIAGGPWVWTGVALLGVGIIVDTITPVQTMGADLMKMEKPMVILIY